MWVSNNKEVITAKRKDLFEIANFACLHTLSPLLISGGICSTVLYVGVQ